MTTAGSLQVFRAEVVKPLRLRPGMHRYLPALASQIAGRVAETVVNHRPRRFGRSKSACRGPSAWWPTFSIFVA